MRMRFRQESFPTREQILKYSEGSKHETTILVAITVLYSTLKIIGETIGFSLIRFQFENIEIILHKQSFNMWVLNFEIYEKRNKD